MAELFPFHVRLWVLLSTLVLAAVCNLILEFTTQSKEDLLPCVYCRRQHKSCEDDESKDIDTSSGSISSVVSGKDVTTECVTNELTQDHNGVGQNPIFIMYQGRRPSTMSVYSGSSLDDMYALPSTGDILPSGQNPMFLMHQGRRSSTVSAYSMDSLDGTVPLTSRRLSIDSLVRNGERKVSFTSPLSQDSLDGLPASLSSQSSSSQCYPPLTISTVVCANEDPVRALSPIRETEDDHEVEEPPLTTSESQRKVSIQRSDSYIAALNSVAANNLTEFSQC